ncbi:hypothetical protein [Rhodovulum euryhalinum]|uniref:Uncharacterized protein n=1 Tax=Rhodovulum euryhalinum TaxID=35805 RepID=A0A4R2KLI8_9RHOB|nr:hypothetical protein [Rhodovulum euryhalinum]TCO71556.1 hypothetical protein EV655_10648 [Rhodovulum euryhalinum]
MGKILIGLVIGLLLGGVGAFLTLGVGAGVGVATGLSTGICATVKAAGDLGIMTPEQVDEVLTRAAQSVSGAVDLPEGEPMVGSAAECEAFMARLKDAAAK